MKALTIHRPTEAAVVDIPVPDPGPTDILVKVAACGICGTDVHIYRGEYLGEYPVIPGHEFAGEVTAVGERVDRIRVGDRVAIEPNVACDNCYNCLNNRQNFCLNWQAVGVTRPGGMAEYVVAPEKAAFDIGSLSFEEAAFVEPLSCVVHGIERAEVHLGDRIAILGAGPIGLLLLQAARGRGASDITVLERQPARLDLARAYGARLCISDLGGLTPSGYDVVIDATGAPEVMAQTVGLARGGGTVLLFGVPPRGSTLMLDAFTIFEKGLTLRSSFTSLRNSYQAIALLQSGAVAVRDLVSHRLPLEHFDKGVAMIEQGLDGVKKVLMVP
ncbi:MAG: zinc-dependent alcohol dehydrogenase family protein [Anaerolineae bacterium]|jgi:2-desacetyl-2-hydroxyethyl bacteriochlorophyllide A dehydrogenase|nr:zinc-dependent alcohol dehydrogenase family protein [Anaerolineae bacterium]